MFHGSFPLRASFQENLTWIESQITKTPPGCVTRCSITCWRTAPGSHGRENASEGMEIVIQVVAPRHAGVAAILLEFPT